MVLKVNPGEKLQQEVFEQLKLDLITGTTSTLQLSSAKMEYLRSIIRKFFTNLEERLQKSGLSYLNILPFGVDDLGPYCSRLEAYLEKAKSELDLNDSKLQSYSEVIRKYADFLPGDLLAFRNRLLDIRAAQLKGSFETQRDDSLAVLDSALFIKNQPASVTCTSTDIEEFLNKVRLSDESRAKMHKVIDLIGKAIQNSELSEFTPKLVPFGSLVTGLSTFNSDIDVVIMLESLSMDIFDYETSMFALEVVRVILERNLGLKIQNECIFRGRRCPIISLNFASCLPYGTSNMIQCDIGIRQSHGRHNSNLIKFLVSYDHRFYEMAMLIKWWASNKDLIGMQFFGHYGLYLMIIYFLQNTNPPVLPTIERLQQLAEDRSDKKSTKGHYNFDFCEDLEIVGKSGNDQSTAELLVEFFRFYHAFEYQEQAICPRTGKTAYKKRLEMESKTNPYDSSSIFRGTYIAVQDPFVPDNNCGGIYTKPNFDRWNSALADVLCNQKINTQNCVKVLTRVGRKKQM